eukprot:jgi/Mesen1/4833/ME000243S03998
MASDKEQSKDEDVTKSVTECASSSGDCVKNLKRKTKEEREEEKEQKRRKREVADAERLRKREEADKKREEKDREREEKRKKKQDEDAEKERRRKEQELKRQQAEAEKEMKRKLKEEEDAERERKRKEKEAKEHKHQLALKKQAGILGRFFSVETNIKAEKLSNAIPAQVHLEVKTDVIDKQLHGMQHISLEKLLRENLTAWREASQLEKGKLQRWGSRRCAKPQPIKELLIQRQSQPAHIPVIDLDNVHNHDNATVVPESKFDHPVDIKEVTCKKSSKFEDQLTRHAGEAHDIPESRPCRRRKLLQFHENNRPAFWGSQSCKSSSISARRPFGKDQCTDYSVDSDEEWEEEEPGESLTDSEKDDNEDKAEMKEEEEEDEFVVPDGYLSEDEGVPVDSTSDGEGHAPTAPLRCTTLLIDNPELVRQEKLLQQLDSATEKALHRNRPLIICNLLCSSLEGEDGELTALELGFLDALSLQVVDPSTCIQSHVEQDLEDANEDEEGGDVKKAATPRSCSKLFPHHALVDLVKFLQESSHGMKRNVDLLSVKYPAVAKRQLEAKIREIAKFAENRWQVKSEIVEELGLGDDGNVATSSPGTTAELPKALPAGIKPITTFFTKMTSE